MAAELDDDMPVCWWPQQRPVEKRPLPGWPRHRVGDDRSVWVQRKRKRAKTGRRRWRQLRPRILNGRAAVILVHDGREHTRMVDLLHRAAFSAWPDRWIERIGPRVSLRAIPRPAPPPAAIPPAIAPPAAPVAPPPAVVDDDDDDRPRRHPRGSAHGRAVLDECKVAEARALHAAGFGIEALMERYPVSRMTLYYAITGTTWQHVPMPATNPKNMKRAEKSASQRALDMHDGGMTAEAIAAELGVGVRTVYRYLS